MIEQVMTREQIAEAQRMSRELVAIKILRSAYEFVLRDSAVLISIGNGQT